MKLFGEANVLHGSIAWTSPLRIRLPVSEPLPPPEAPPLEPASPEYDEDGRLYVFRFARTSPPRYTIERDRIFEYRKGRRFPDEGQRQIRRDLRNQADVYADLRDLQTPYEVREA